MSLTYPNIVPDNNLRLPDALTIKHGPARLLAKFSLEGDKAARRMGLRLRLRHDFEELVYLNRQQVAKGTWFRLVNTYNPDFAELTPENAFWVSGEDEHGEIAVTWAGRVYYWPDTNLEEQARTMFYGRSEVGECKVTAPVAKLITGVVNCGGALWVRSDFRSRYASRLFPRIGKAYACSRWPIDWTICYTSRILVEKGVAAGWGMKDLSYSIFYPDSPWGDLEVVVAYAGVRDVYDDLASFLATELSENENAASDASSFFRTPDDKVTNISSEAVRHGNSIRS
jgi:hypothetical protein